MAFSLPIQWEHGAGISVVATHVDSPNLKVHPALNILDIAHFFRFVPFPSVRRWDTCKLESKRMEGASGTPGWTVTFQSLDAWLSQKDPVLLGPNL